MCKIWGRRQTTSAMNKNNEFWPNCCRTGVYSLVAEQKLTAEEATQLEKGRKRASFRSDRAPRLNKLTHGSARPLVCGTPGSPVVLIRRASQRALNRALTNTPALSECVRSAALDRCKHCGLLLIRYSHYRLHSLYEQSMYDFVDCEKLLEGIVYPKRVNRRGAINNLYSSSRALALGHYTHGGVCGITAEIRRRPWPCKRLANFAVKHKPEAKFSVLQISCNAPVSWHRDSHNDRNHLNYVCGFGDYKNGQLWIEDEAAIEEGSEVVEQPLEFSEFF